MYFGTAFESLYHVKELFTGWLDLHLTVVHENLTNQRINNIIKQMKKN